MAKKAILKGRVVKQYRANYLDTDTAEARDIGSYLYRRFQGNYVTWFNWLSPKLHWRDVEKRLEVIAKISVILDSPFTLQFKATIRYPESSAKRAEEIMTALAAYNSDSMRTSESSRPCPCSC